MKQPSGKDWHFTIVLTVLVILTLVLAMLDPSCQYRGTPTRAIPTR